MEQIINESDSNEQKVKDAVTAPAVDGGQDSTEPAGAQLIDLGGLVSPAERTAGSAMPDLPEGKRKRGRPSTMTPEERREKKRAADRARRSGKKAPAKDANGDEIPDHIQAAALYNMVLVAGCKLVSDEYEQTDEMQGATIKAACEYFESIDVNLPPWAGLLAVSGMNIAAALKTPGGKGKVSGAWSKVRAWWMLRKG